MSETSGAPKTGTAFAGLLADLAIVGGAGLISVGAWMIYHPAAFLVGGGFLLTGGWIAARRGL